MNAFDLNGQRIALLGGTSGLGLATAQLAAAQGARVVIASRTEARLAAALETLPATAEGHVADLASERSIEALMAELGSFDHLLFTAGENLVLNELAATDLTTARGFFETRLWGALTAAKHAAPRIRPGGSIVLMSGSAATRPQARWTVAAAICGAIEAVTRALAVELAPLRVNAVAPGVVRTPLWGAMEEADRDAMYTALADQLLVGRVGEASDVALGILQLMANGYTTGITLPIDGGATLV